MGNIPPLAPHVTFFALIFSAARSTMAIYQAVLIDATGFETRAQQGVVTLTGRRRTNLSEDE